MILKKARKPHFTPRQWKYLKTFFIFDAVAAVGGGLVQKATSDDFVTGALCVGGVSLVVTAAVYLIAYFIAEFGEYTE